MFTQITDTTEGNFGRPEINSDGTLIVFNSRSIINGGNTDENNEIFLAECGSTPTSDPGDGDGDGSVVVIPTMTEWGMIFASIIIGIFAVIALRRRTES